MSERVAKWQQDLQRKRGEFARLSAELQRWELLPAATAAERGERSRQGSTVRVTVTQLKSDVDRLEQELQGIPERGREHAELLAQAKAEIAELERRSKASPNSSQGWPVAANAASCNGVSEAGPQGDFVRMADGPAAGTTAGGAELQLSQRAMLDRQRQMMKDLERPLSTLEGQVGTLRDVSLMIRNEVASQNRMLEGANDSADRVQGRLRRVQDMLGRFSQANNQRYLMVSVVLLLCLLIALFVYIVLP